MPSKKNNSTCFYLIIFLLTTTQLSGQTEKKSEDKESEDKARVIEAAPKKKENSKKATEERKLDKAPAPAKATEAPPENQEKSEIAREKEQLEQCGQMVAYGNEGAANYVEIGYLGLTRKFYFEEAIVAYRGERDFQLHIPEFQRRGGRRILELQSIGINPDFFDKSKYEASDLGYMFSGTDCLKFPSDANDNLSSAKVTRWTKPENGQNGIWEASIKYENPDIPENYITIKVSTNNIKMANNSGKTVSNGYFKKDGKQKEVASASFEYFPNRELLKFSAGTSKEGGSFSAISSRIQNFTGEPGIYTNPPRSMMDKTIISIFDVKEFSRDKVVLEEYEVIPENYEEKEAKAFFDEEYLTFDLEPEDGNLVASIGGNNVSYAIETDPVTYQIVHEASDDRIPATHLEPDDLTANYSSKYKAIKPFASALTIGKKQPVGKYTWKLTNENNNLTWNLTSQTVALENKNPQEGSVDELLIIYNKVKEKTKTFSNDKDTATFKRSLLNLTDNFNLKFEGSISDPVRELHQNFKKGIKNTYNQDTFAVFRDQMEVIDDFSKFNVAMPVDLTIDKETGQPLERNYTNGDTEISIHYGNGKAKVTAENPAQGNQSTNFALPEGCLDIYQFYKNLAYLPLNKMENAKFCLFDLEVNKRSSFSFSMDGKSRQSRRKVIEPLYAEADLKVLGQQKIKTSNGKKPVYKVSITMDGQFENMPGQGWVEEQLNYSYPYTAIYYLKKSFPHKIVKVDFGEGITFENNN